MVKSFFTPNNELVRTRKKYNPVRGNIPLLDIIRYNTKKDLSGDWMKTGFGWIEFDGERYDYDIVIHGDRSVTKRKKKLSKKRKEEFGHTPLSGEELAEILRERPDVMYIGTGQYGDLPLTKEAVTLLAPFALIIKPTPDILPLLEAEQRTFAAVLHVTC